MTGFDLRTVSVAVSGCTSNPPEVRGRTLAANDRVASRLRDRFRTAGTLAVHLISSPGSGKTRLLEGTAVRLLDHRRMAAVVADVATDRDARRLRGVGLPAWQVVTGGGCHLDAQTVSDALDRAGFGDLDLVLMENVGGLLCPGSYDLGEGLRVVLLSVTEGDDKPFKYPELFAKADVTLLTKWDLLPFVRFDVGAVCEQIQSLRRGARILPLSAVTGDGMDTWCRLLEEQLLACKAAAVP